ncbi:hypothetical protein CYY_002047 [Polysphondylium violaceum]|uniref:Phosphatidylinositol-3,4,5-trisphosphate 3-phosphatase n=1 Tax=Polysphondylium violaceum TaxID=133409 RepID=A0A8J4Q210_9MYCE|nr:hypothetical protein CYY_002047 [Polysphondylium violaceum]
MDVLFKQIQLKALVVEDKLNSSVKTAVTSIRTAVSVDKNRFINDKFNLDLTYITPKLIAFGYPAIDKLGSDWWRNSRIEVKDFLETYHKDHYLIINLTEKAYDSQFFNNRVHHIGWPDNHAPSLGLLLYAVQIIHNWLDANSENIVAVHCAAGRGRTGTLICSYLLTTLAYESRIEDVLSLFATQRSSIGEGIKVPSQFRYVDYVNQLFTCRKNVELVQNTNGLLLKSIVLKNIPTKFIPMIEVFNVSKPLEPVLLLSTKEKIINNNCSSLCKIMGNIAMIEPQGILLAGDILIKISSATIIGKLVLENDPFRFSFHTSFIDDFYLDLKKCDLDEKDTQLKSNKYPEDFSIRLMFMPNGGMYQPYKSAFYAQQS